MWNPSEIHQKSIDDGGRSGGGHRGGGGQADPKKMPNQMLITVKRAKEKTGVGARTEQGQEQSKVVRSVWQGSGW